MARSWPGPQISTKGLGRRFSRETRSARTWAEGGWTGAKKEAAKTPGIKIVGTFPIHIENAARTQPPNGPGVAEGKNPQIPPGLGRWSADGRSSRPRLLLIRIFAPAKGQVVAIVPPPNLRARVL